MKVVIRIKKETPSVKILSIFFLVLFILDYEIFYLFEIPGFMRILKDNQLNLVTGFLGILLSGYYYSKYKYETIKLYNRNFLYAITCAIIWIILVIYSIILYEKQPIRLSLGFHATFLYFFLCIPALVIFQKSHNKMKLFDIMNWISIIWYIIIIFQHFVYAASHTLIFNMQELMSNSSRDMVRNYGIRISLKSLGNLMILYNFDIVFNKRKTEIGRKISFISLALGLYCLIVIQQTRSMLFIILCSIAIIMLFGAKRIRKKIIVLAIMVFGFAFFIQSGILSDFFSSFSTKASNANRLGTTIRLGAIAYYFECFLRNPLLGNGFSSSLYYPEVQHSSSMLFYYVDVGIFGLLGEVGLMAIPLYVYPLVRITRNTFNLFKRKLLTNYSFLAGITSYLLFSSLTFLITTPQLMLAFPIIYAYSEIIGYENSQYNIKVEG